ncbi:MULTISPECIES: rod shape-determining protein [Blautia]|jgi:rod shape-determining protein MreB|uniref:Chaperone protein DnaK n=1 Tax=Blautia wexlerae TaxID=418240 RepID=A0ABX2GLP3_9FIRM|nr:rod shape-determining protein [Blautia wexlerae]MDD7419493.1 rod shape-determining protein [Ruminococcus sp.]NSF73177.1 rod shape-determining protein [Blautia wexlerae]
MLFEKTYGIDLGSSSVKVYSLFKNKSYMEKNMIASRGHKIIAVGNEAYEMFEKSPAEVAVCSPMSFGMIANLELQEIVLYSMIRRIDHILGVGSVMFFTVPLDMTAVEKRAYFNVANGYWLRKNRVYMVESPIADALAMGVDLDDPTGNMVVNMGAQSTEMSIITGGRIIISKKIPIGGRQMNESICTEIRKRYNLQLGTRTAKRLKMVMGRLSDQRKGVRKVVGIDCISGLPREEVISSYVVNDGIMNCVNEIASEMKTFLERIPPQISYHIAKQGIYITGGSTRLPYLDKYLASYTGFTFNMSDLYEKSAVSGLEKIIKNKELRKWAMPVKQRKL